MVVKGVIWAVTFPEAYGTIADKINVELVRSIVVPVAVSI
jgi:hypothetical protein